MIPPFVSPPPEAASAPLALQGAALEFCRGVAVQMRWEAKQDPVQLKAMRNQASALLSLCVKTLPPEDRALPLLEAALGALESALGEEVSGEKRFGRAAKTLALLWRNAQKTWGSGSPQRLPELENLALLYELGGLRSSCWRDEALRIRVGTFRNPDPKLEQDLAAAVEDHYGPWLTVVELEPMLESCQQLARVWLSYREDGALTRQVLKLGLKPDAERVWKLAAKKSAEGPRREMTTLLERLDPQILLQQTSGPKGEGDLRAVLGLAEALKGTPLEVPAKELLKRLDARLREPGQTPRQALLRRLARVREDWDGYAALLLEALAESNLTEEGPEAWGEAEQFLRNHPDARLLALGAQRLKASLQGRGSVDLGALQRLETWADLERGAGHPEEADELLRLRLTLEAPKGQDLPSRCELLARLGLWKDLESYLGVPKAEESELLLGWRFRVALAQGKDAEAQRWVAEWFARVADPEGPEEPLPLPGLSWAIPQLRGQLEALTRLATRCGSRLLPGQEALLAREPWRILAALDPEAPASLQPAKAEEALRWRWSRLPGDESRVRSLAGLIEDAERQLGASHLLVAELLTELGDRQKEEGLESLAKAQRILEFQPGHEALLLRIHVAMAAACSQLDGKGLERNLLKAVEILERTPGLNEETDSSVREMPMLLLMHLWREQRLEELLVLGARVQALAQRAPKPNAAAAEVGESLLALTRVARLQSQLRAAGLP